MVTLPPCLVSNDFGTCSYQCFLFIIIIIITTTTTTTTATTTTTKGNQHVSFPTDNCQCFV